MILENMINSLLKHESVDDEVLQNAVASVVISANLNLEKNKIRKSFCSVILAYLLVQMIYLTSCNGRVDTRCTCYNDLEYKLATEQTNVSVPILQTFECSGFHKYLNAHFSKKEGESCKKCN